MQAALLNVERRPKTHKGTLTLFGSQYIRTGKIDKRFSQDLRRAYNLRQSGDYDVNSELEEEQITDMVQRAGEFISEVKRLLQ